MENKNRPDKTTRTKTILECLGLFLALVLLAFGVMIYHWHKLRPLREAKREFMDLCVGISDAYDAGDWGSVVQLHEKLLRIRADASSPDPNMMGWMIAKAYFHTERYEQAVHIQRKYIEYEKKHPGIQADSFFGLAWLPLAQYLSFAYAKTGDDSHKDELEQAIKDYFLTVTSEPIVYTGQELYHWFGPIKYRLDTRLLDSDETWRERFSSTAEMAPYDYERNQRNEFASSQDRELAMLTLINNYMTEKHTPPLAYTGRLPAHSGRPAALPRLSAYVILWLQATIGADLGFGLDFKVYTWYETASKDPAAVWAQSPGTGLH